MKKIISTPLLLLCFFGSFAQFSPGKSLNFNGTNAYVLTNFSGIKGKASRTIEAWVKAGPYNSANGSGNDQRVIFDYGTTTGSGGRFTTAIQWAQRNFRTEIGGNGNQGATSFLDGYWHHVAVVYDSAASSGKTTTYVDGIQDWNGDYSVTLNTGTTTTFRIGVRIDGVNYFLGEIDEVRFWKTVRTATEIADNMFKRVDPSNPNLVAYYDFDASNAGTGGVPDLVTANTSHNGTLTNMTASDVITSTAPIHAQNNITNTRGIWNAYPGSTASGGLTINAASVLTDGNTATYGQTNSSTATVSTDLPITLSQRFERVWAVDINGSVTANMYFNVPTILASSVSLGAPSNYHLLYRNTTSGTFTDLGSATTIIGTTQVQFSNIILQDGYYTMASDNLLPLNLLKFTANKQNKNVLIQWQTGNEKNLNKYIVEKKTGTENWNILGTVLAQNFLIDKNTYQLVDESPGSGENFYKLIAIDNDGKTTVSNIISVNMANNVSIRLFPNPAKNYINIKGIAYSEISIKNVIGQTMKCNIPTSSNSNFTIDVSNFTNGVYFIITPLQQISFIKE